MRLVVPPTQVEAAGLTAQEVTLVHSSESSRKEGVSRLSSARVMPAPGMHEVSRRHAASCTRLWPHTDDSCSLFLSSHWLCNTSSGRPLWSCCLHSCGRAERDTKEEPSSGFTWKELQLRGSKVEEWGVAVPREQLWGRPLRRRE